MTSKRTTRWASAATIAAASPPILTAFASPASAGTPVDRPDSFTSAFTAMATPDLIIDNDGNAVPGQEGATGTFNFMINSDEEIICYEITLNGVTAPYQSPAKTATHIHEAPEGEAGPPRLAFPDPEGDRDEKSSSGCFQGPFTTGLSPDGTDTGEGFTLDQIEANPSEFFADTHTVLFPAGAVRGQLVPMPVGGVDTGQGGSASSTPTGLIAVAAAAGVGLAGAGVAMRRRQGA